MRLKVYIPTKFCQLAPLHGSAIVAEAKTSEDWILAYYEGNRYGIPSMDCYEDKLAIAAGRLVERYPTVARRLFRTCELDEIGTYDTDSKVFNAHPGNALDRLKLWIGEPRYVHCVRVGGSITPITSRFTRFERDILLDKIAHDLAPSVHYEDGVKLIRIFKGKKPTDMPLMLATDSLMIKLLGESTIRKATTSETSKEAV